MQLIRNIGLIILICMATGCCTRKLKDCQNLKADDPKIIEFANKCANTCGSTDLTTFKQPVVIEHPDDWYVFYGPKDPGVFGHCFGVRIDRKTCESNVEPGS